MSVPLDDQERQRLTAAYAELCTLAGGLAHEVRNPLSTISLNLELLIEDIEASQTPENRRMLMKVQTVQRECKHLQNILDAFLEFVRVGELKLAPCDLNQLVRDFIEFYQPQADEQKIELSPHLASDLPTVNLDSALMRQVLMNLTLNAQQAMPDGGLLELQTYLRDGRVQLDFIDNGAGIAAATRARVFEPFYSTRRGGTGLGLPTVRRIIEAHHGTIACESEVDRGTRFTISLPVA